MNLKTYYNHQSSQAIFFIKHTSSLGREEASSSFNNIELRTTFTNEAASRTEKIKYLVVNAPSAYNILLGRPTLNRIGVVPSTRHMKVKLPSMEGVVITIRSDQKEAKKCYENSLKTKRSVSYVTTTLPPGVEPRSAEGRVVDTAMGVITVGDEIMPSLVGSEMCIRDRPEGG